jgi:cytochrome P450
MAIPLRRGMTAAAPPGPRINMAFAVMAQLLPGLFQFDPLEFGVGNARAFGDIVYYKAGPLRVFQVSHPDYARQVLVEEPEKFHKPRLIKKAFAPFAGEGLLTSDGPLWKRQRRLMQPAFHHGALASYAEVMVGHGRRSAETFTDGQVVELQAEMSALTLAIVVECLFGGDVTRHIAEVSRLMVAVLEGSNHRLTFVLTPPSWVPTPRNLRERRALARLDEILHDLIAARRAAAGGRHDLLSMLLTAVDQDGGERMSDGQLRDEMMTLFLAGHETTANLLTWTWYLLSQHPAVETALLEEVDGVLQGRAPSAADLPNLPRTEMVVRESLRLYPPAPGVAREPIEDVTIGGYPVPKGSLVTVNTFAMHRDARFFPEPERFDPDRFAPGWEQRIPRYAYLPFGGGPRVCIGNSFAVMEARLILATLAQRWRLSLEPGQDVRPMQLVTVRVRHGVRMRLAAREIS